MFKNHTLILLAVLSIFLQHATCYALSWSENNPDEINPGGSISISIVGNCPPYTWEVKGKGYSIGSSITQEKFNTLYSDDESCGYVTISVVDNCGEKITESARGNVGHWVLVVNEMCGELQPPPTQSGSCPWCEKCSQVIIGALKYKDCWQGGGFWEKRYLGPYCSKWPETVDIPNLPHPENTCRDHAYWPLQTLRDLFDHQMWRWVCPGVDLEFPPGSENDDCKQYQ